MGELSVRMHDDPDCISADAWAGLTARPPASIAGSRPWLEAALATVDRECDPCILTAWDSGRLVALLSTVLDPGERVMRLAGAPSNDLADLMVRQGYEFTAAPIVCRCLSEVASRGWSLRLEDLDPDGALARADVEPARLRREESWDAPVLDLADRRTSTSHRLTHRLDRSLEELRQGRQIEFRFVTGSVMLGEFPEFVRIRDIRLRAKGRNMRDPPPELLGAVVNRLAPLERCGFMELLVDGVVVARDLYLLDGGVAMLWLRALDMGWLHYSCGHLLLRAATERLADRGFQALDFGRGGEQYKYRFGARKRVLVTVVMPSSTL